MVIFWSYKLLLFLRYLICALNIWFHIDMIWPKAWEGTSIFWSSSTSRKLLKVLLWDTINSLSLKIILCPPKIQHFSNTFWSIYRWDCVLHFRQQSDFDWRHWWCSACWLLPEDRVLAWSPIHTFLTHITQHQCVMLCMRRFTGFYDNDCNDTLVNLDCVMSHSVALESLSEFLPFSKDMGACVQKETKW